MNWNAPKLTWVDGAKWAAIAGTVGTLIGLVVSPNTIDTLAAWGDAALTFGTAAMGAITAFALAARRK